MRKNKKDVAFEDWGEFQEEQEAFRDRLIQLRMQNGASARDMSMSIGLNGGYITNIESGKAMPSMTAFFAICNFLQITPKDFFEIDSVNPSFALDLVKKIETLPPKDQQAIAAVVDSLQKR